MNLVAALWSSTIISRTSQVNSIWIADVNGTDFRMLRERPITFAVTPGSRPIHECVPL